jgi:hypothetical protein
MDLNKSWDFFKPTECKGKCHIIGCGSVGSTLAENLARLGITDFVLYDFDNVESHNIANQMFVDSDIGKPKTEAVARMITAINPDIKDSIKIYPEGYKGQKLSGYVFLCVDNIDLRREIATKNKHNMYIKGMFDVRTRLTDAQHYAADWHNPQQVESFIASMQFSHDEAKEATPVSACHMTLSVAPTIRIIVAYEVANFMNFVTKNEIRSVVLIDAFNFFTDAT